MKKQDNNVEVFYNIPVSHKIMIRESAIKDWDDEDEIKEYIYEHCTLGESNDINIESIG